MTRVKIAEFGIINTNLKNAVVTFYTTNADGSSTGTKATLYQASTGTASRENPQTLTADGKLSADCYVESAVVAAVTGINDRTTRSLKKIQQNPTEYLLPITSSNFSNQAAGDLYGDLAAVEAAKDAAVAVLADAGFIAVSTDLTGDDDIGTVADSIASVNTVAADLSGDDDIGTVAADLAGSDNVGTVAGSIANVNAVGGSITNVNSVAGNATNINIVAADGTDIGTVATSIADVNSVAGSISDVSTVATDLAGSDTIGTVAADIADVSTVAGSIASVITAANGIANINTVAGITVNIGLVAAIDSDVSAVAAIDTDVSAVAAIDTAVTAVGSITANVTTVANNILDVNALAAITTDIQTLADIEDGTDATDAIQTVAGIASDVSTVAADGTDIGTVAAIITDIQTLADIEDGTDATDAIQTVAGIAASIPTVSAISSDVSTVAGISADVSAVAAVDTQIAALALITSDITDAANNIPKANRTATTDPTVNNDVDEGYSEGSLWVNTTSDEVFICGDPADGAAVWVSLTSGGTLSTLGDVSFTSLASGDFMRYNGSLWINRTPAQVRADLDLEVGTDVAAYTISNASFQVLTGTDAQTLWDENDTALLNARSTGVRFGGNLSDLGSGVVRITAGAGQILDNTDPENPTYTAVIWSQTDLDLSASDDVYYIYVNSSGTVTSTTTEPSHADYRTDLYLWRVSIRSAAVSGTTSIVQSSQQNIAQIWDIFRGIGYFKSGLALSAASTNLTIAISAGEVYLPGVNFYTSALNPHELEVSARSPATFRHVDQDGDQTADRTAIDVGNYDNAGTITAISGAGSRATIFQVMEFPGSGNIRIFYGQTIYNNVDEAEQALQQGTYNPTIPAAYSNAVTLGWIIAEKSATNLADGTQKFITSNKFGLTGGSIATSGANALLATNNLSDLDDTATALVNLGVDDESIQDLVGAMVTGNTETRITVTYQDGDGTLDFVVDDDLANYDNTNSAFITSAQAPVQTVNGQSGTVVLDPDDLDDTSTTNKFTTAADISKLAGIEAGADVTDTANVTAAGAVMDSEVTDLDGIKSLTVPNNTTISAFGATLVNNADAAAAQTTLDVYSTSEVDAAVAGASGDVVLLDTITASGTGTSVSFTGFADDTEYSRYYIEYNGVISSVNTAGLYFVMSQNNGSSYLSSYRTSGANTVSVITLASAITDGVSTGSNGRVDIYNQDTASAFTACIHETVHYTSSVIGFLSFTQGAGTALTAGVCDAFRIYVSSGNITGTFRLFGVKK